MKAAAHVLFLFSLLYAVYTLSAFQIWKNGREEISSIQSRIPSVWLLAPIKLLLWVVLLPFASVFEGLLLAFVAFCAASIFVVAS
jgi:hypothetical protein